MLLGLAPRAAFAQDTAPPPSAAPDPVAPAAPPDDAPPAPPPDAPPPPATPPDATAPSEPVLPTPIAPAPTTPAPKTGNASFEPLPAPAQAPSSRPRKPPAQPGSDAPIAPATAASDDSAAGPRNGNAGVVTPPVVPQADASDSDDSNGVFGPFRIGGLIGGGLPDLVSLSGMIKVTRFFGAGINVGIIPTVHISYYGDATLSFQEYDAYGHIFPFGGAFFLGAGVGYATVKGTLATHFDLSSYQKANPGIPIPASLDVTSQASVRTLVLLPKIGLLHTFGSGFTLGADVGAQIPIAPSQVDFATQVPGSIPEAIKEQYVTPNDQKVRASLDKIGRTPIPTFGIKIGWLL